LYPQRSYGRSLCAILTKDFLNLFAGGKRFGNSITTENVHSLLWMNDEAEWCYNGKE
jgi:hypothetical protein